MMEHNDYAGPLWKGDGTGDGKRDWTGDALAPELERALARPDSLTLLAHGVRPRVVLGVPHHAPRGVSRIAMQRPGGDRPSDENAALYALVCFSALAQSGVACRLVVASQARDHDPNKDESSPYCCAVLAEPASLLLECHGASARAPHDLELSAGQNERARALDFGRDLAAALGDGFQLAVQERAGSRRGLLLDAAGNQAPARLRFPALNTGSLSAAGARGIAALHLEAKPRFRRAGPGGGPSDSGARLGRALAEALARASARGSAADA